ncbi:MAG: MBL fold metallo-hydrolase [Ectothiorhodospiraceae bacterium]|nr:MBL fold metallo-hydrolase [Ectothiorhodospiraceae bacterium]
MSEQSMIDYPTGITAIDTGFAGTRMLAASHLLLDNDEAALVDVGSNFSVPAILRALERKGVERARVRYVCVTHVHLDHAGGAGELMRQLPEATLVVHPRGARHMIDPSALYQGALQVYGEEIMARHYGRLVPVAEDRVRVVEEGDRLPLGERTLRFLDTPGHANHHYCIFDEAERVVFSGDTFGVSYRSLDTARGAVIFPATSPVHFDPEAAHQSVERLRTLEPQAIYLTHFGEVRDIPRLAEDLHQGIDAHVEIALRHADAGEARGRRIADDLLDWFHHRLQEHGCGLDKARVRERMALDIELNTQGLQVWLQRR